MKIYALTLFALVSCYRAPITLSGGPVTPPKITCVCCDTLPKGHSALITKSGDLKIVGGSVELGGLITKNTEVIDDSSAIWIYKRLQEITDSIKLIKKETAWLDSINRSTDTVKWKPYYYKPKKK